MDSLDPARTALLVVHMVRGVAGHNEARAVVESNGGGSGIGLAYSRDMIHPAG